MLSGCSCSQIEGGEGMVNFSDNEAGKNCFKRMFGSDKKKYKGTKRVVYFF